MEWYAVHTHANQEDRAVSHLARLGVETFLPRARETRRTREGRRSVIVPLFPGYLFARLEVERHLRAVSYARGVRRVVAFGAVPAVVPDEVVESVRSRLVDGVLTWKAPHFEPGESVRVTEGPLGGLDAVFERELPAHQRVVLLLRSLPYAARVVVAADAIAHA